MEETLQREIPDLIRELTNSLLTHFKSAILEQINLSNDSFTIGSGADWRYESELDEEISKKFGMKILFVDKPKPLGAIALLVALSGQLEDLFKTYKITPYIVLGIMPDPVEEHLTFRSEADLPRIYLCSLLYQPNTDIKVLSEFVDSINKFTLFSKIKHS